MKQNRFENFRFVSESTLGTFFIKGFGYINISHRFENGAIQFGADAIFGHYWDLVEFFIEHCSNHHQPDMEFWQNKEAVEEAWSNFKKLNVQDTKTQIELCEKCELVLAAYQEYGIFYTNLFNK